MFSNVQDSDIDLMLCTDTGEANARGTGPLQPGDCEVSASDPAVSGFSLTRPLHDEFLQ